MKRFITIFAAAMLFAVGCESATDLSEVNDRLDSLEQRMSAAEALLKANENGLCIVSVQQTTDGYVFFMSDGSQVAVYNGKDGQNGTNGSAGTSLVKSIAVGDTEVTFTLTDGRTFSIPLYSALSITFDKADLELIPDYSERNVHYTVHSNLTDNITVEVVTSADILAEVVKESATTGYITIITTTVTKYSRVLVFVSNGEKTITKAVPLDGTVDDDGQDNEGEDNGSQDAETEHTGTLQDPLSVADAIAVAKATGTTQTSKVYYVAGTISVIKYPFDTNYGTATFDIVDEGSEDVFTAYAIKYFDNQSWTEGNTQVAEGDKVVVAGNIINYGGNTPEIASKTGWLVQLNDEKGSDSEGDNTPVLGTGFVSDSYFVCTTDDSNNKAYSIGPSTFNGQEATGFKLGTSSTGGKFTSGAVSVEGDCTLDLYAVAWKGKAGTLTVSVEGNGEVLGTDSYALTSNDGANNSAPFTVTVTDSDHYTFKLTGLTPESQVVFECDTRLIAAGVHLRSGIDGDEDNNGGATNDPERWAYSIEYTSSDGNIVEPYNNSFGDEVNIMGNFYEGGKGTILFNAPVTKIGNQAFYYCSNLASITIPDSVTKIDSYAFFSCSYLTDITIPESVTSIGDYAFRSCTSLANITIPNSVTTIGEAAFRSCTGIASINIPNSVTSIGYEAFRDCSRLANISLPNSKSIIGNGAFYHCTSLVSVTIPEEVIAIGDYAFYSCTNLSSVYCKIIIPIDISNYVFGDNADGRKFYVPYKSLDAYKTADGWSRYADDIVGYYF